MHVHGSTLAHVATVEAVDGVIVVDKPRQWTSHDVVNKVRRLAATKKVGHLGTLDPNATGVLPLVVGRATRLAQFYGHNSKTYEGLIHFGFATDSYDSDGEPLGPPQPVALTMEMAESALAPFRGRFAQTPPPVSAKKIAGRPAYELARKNLPVELKPVEVEVFSLEIQEVSGCEARVRVRCSAGTYVRGIAHDAGRRLGCGAHLKELRRTVSGDFTLASAYTLEQLAALSEQGRIADALIPAVQLLPHIPSATVDAITAGQIRNGRDFRTSPFALRAEGRYVKAVSSAGELIAIGEARLPHLYHPVLVL